MPWMLCPSYTDPRLAAVYDPLNPPGAAERFYLDLAGDAACSILDVGCGTGWLACELAARGHRVTGVDPAHAMLDIARARPGAGAVTWIPSDAATLALDTRADLILMTGHVFQVFLQDQDVIAALSNLRGHLAPGGRIAFETRNAAVREWEKWTPEQTLERIEVPGSRPVEVHFAVRALAGPYVTYETHFRGASGEIVVTASTLRFMTRGQVAVFLAKAGLDPVAWYGDWDRSPCGLESSEIIAIARSRPEPRFTRERGRPRARRRR